MLYPKQTNCSENGNIDSLISSIDCRLSKLANTMYNNTVFMLNKTISGTEMFDLIQYKRILYYKQINPTYVDCFSVNQIASQVKRFTANCTGNCNGNGNDNNIFPAPPIRTTTTTSSTTCPPTTSTTSSTTTNTTTCKPSGLTFFTLTTEIVYESITYNFSEMTSLEICELLLSICYPYTGDFTYTTEIGETTAVETGNIIFDPFTPCTFLPNGTYLEGVPGDSCGTVANIFDVVDGVITEVVTTCNVNTTTTTTTSPPEQFKMIADGVITIENVSSGSGGISIDSLSDFSIVWGDDSVDSFTAGNNRQASHTYETPYTGEIIIQAADLSNITELIVQSKPHPNQSLSVTTTELGKLDGLLTFTASNSDGLFVTGDVDDLPNSLTKLTITNTDVSGNTLNLPEFLTECAIFGTNTIDGDTLGLPRNLTYLNIQGRNTISGNTAGLPEINKTIVITGFNTIEGNTSDLPDATDIIEIWGIFPGGNTITGDVGNIYPSKQISITGNNTISGNIGGVNAPTFNLVITGFNEISGNISGLPTTLTNLDIKGNNSVVGDIAGLPPFLEFIQINSAISASATFGDVSDLPSTLKSLVIKSSGTFTGNLYNLPLNIRNFSLTANTDFTYTQDPLDPPDTPRAWVIPFFTLSLPAATGTIWDGFTSVETDKLLNDIQPSYRFSLSNKFVITCADVPKRTIASQVAFDDLVDLIGAGNVVLN
jgi:hypothetical protein